MQSEIKSSLESLPVSITKKNMKKITPIPWQNHRNRRKKSSIADLQLGK